MLILARRGNAVIRLQDVASVQLDHFERRDASTFNGDPNLFVTLRRESGANVIDIKRAMLQRFAPINEQILRSAGLRMVHVADDVQYVEKSVRNVWQNLLLGADHTTTDGCRTAELCATHEGSA